METPTEEGNGHSFQLIRFTTDSPIDELLSDIFGDSVELIDRVEEYWEGQPVFTYHLKVKVKRPLSD